MKRTLTVLWCLLAFPTVALATSFVPGLSLADVVRHSDLVVIGTVVERTTVNAPPGGVTQLETHSVVAIEETLLGKASDTVLIRQLGGEAGGVHERIAGDASLRVGNRVLLFLNIKGAASFGGAAHLALLGLSAYDLKARLDGDYDAVPHDRWATTPATHDPGPLGTGMVSIELSHPAPGQVTRLSFLRALVRDFKR